MHVALRFAYDGSVFPRGYARQPEGGTVEDALLDALRKEGYVADSWVTGSRTDKGVTAAENVAKCALDRKSLVGLVPALQSSLPPGLWVTGAAKVAEDWNPRYHAVRTYTYLASKNGESLDSMARAAERFVGQHDMSGFARVEPHRNPERSIDVCQVTDADHSWRFTVASEGFLWNQVRRMVDAMLAVGRGDAAPADVDATLVSGIPHRRFHMAPPDGLLLQSVRYSPALEWSEEAGSLDVRRVDKDVQRNQVTAALLRNLTGSS